jgi:sarcosine oxidase, subunit gamma
MSTQKGRNPVPSHPGSEISLTHCSNQIAVLVRADPAGAVAAGLGVTQGRAVRDGDGTLVTRTAPDAWLLLAPAGYQVDCITERIESYAGGDFASVVDVTHAHTVVRLHGSAAASVLSRVCAIDLGEAAIPDGTVFGSLVAGISAIIVRDDVDGERSYLVRCDRSYGRYLIDVLADASGAHPADSHGDPHNTARFGMDHAEPRG